MTKAEQGSGSLTLVLLLYEIIKGHTSMISKRTFYRNVITVEVLSEEPLSGDECLSDIAFLIDSGPCSGKVETTIDNEQVNGRRMAQLLQEQASEPGFFGLDEQGRDALSDEAEESENDDGGQESMYEGEVSVELTGLAAMRQRRTVLLDSPLSQSAVEDLVRETAGNYVWDYQGMRDETIEVTVLA